MMLLYCVICMSKLVPDQELKFYIGYVTIGFVALHLICHMSMMTFSSIKTKVKEFKFGCEDETWAYVAVMKEGAYTNEIAAS